MIMPAVIMMRPCISQHASGKQNSISKLHLICLQDLQMRSCLIWAMAKRMHGHGYPRYCRSINRLKTGLSAGNLFIIYAREEGLSAHCYEERQVDAHEYDTSFHTAPPAAYPALA